MGKAVKSVGKIASGVTGGLTDALLGKEKKIAPDKISYQINAAKNRGLAGYTKGLTDYETALAENPADKAIMLGQEAAKTSALTAAQDARRQAQQSMAQRGLQNSSLGLASQRSITQNLGKQLGAIEAQTPGLLREARLGDIQNRMNANSGLFSNLGGSGNVRFQSEKSRSGGLLGLASAAAPLVGTIGGFMAGGPAGAGLGAQLGGMFGGGQASGFDDRAINANGSRVAKGGLN